MKYLLAEKPFYSLQWEAKNNGVPMIFIRFYWCNKDCWFCDSKYSYKPEEADTVLYTHEELIEKIKSFWCKTILRTWGEPSLFQDQIKLLMNELWDEYTHELETNGSKKLEEWLYFDQINISPKLKSSWNKSYELKILDWIKSKCDNYSIKFVCSDLTSLKETDECIKKYEFEPGSIYIMPEWRDVKSQVNQFVIDYCMKKWYSYCLRSHLILFWDGKGK